MIVTGLSAEPLDVRALTDQIRREDCGALVVFEGMTRSPDDGRTVESLTYEAWAESAERQLRDLAERAVQRWSLGGAVAVHRTGDVPPGQPSVVVAASIGSGFAVADGRRLVTNFHVISEAVHHPERYRVELVDPDDDEQGHRLRRRNVLHALDHAARRAGARRAWSGERSRADP